MACFVQSYAAALAERVQRFPAEPSEARAERRDHGAAVEVDVSFGCVAWGVALEKSDHLSLSLSLSLINIGHNGKGFFGGRDLVTRGKSK